MMTFTPLVMELLAFLAAASVLGMFVGWMIRSQIARRREAMTMNSWEQKYQELELRTEDDAQNLEEKIQSLGSELKTITADNQALTEAAKNTEITVHKARADAIELTRQQAETQERLQRIIQRKDTEIATLKATAISAAGGVAAQLAVPTLQASGLGSSRHIDELALRRASLDDGRDRLLDGYDEDQQTIVIDRQDVPGEVFDETVRLDPNALPNARARMLGSEFDNTEDVSDSVDATAILNDGIEMEEATIALDEESLAIARRSSANSLTADGTLPTPPFSKDDN